MDMILMHSDLVNFYTGTRGVLMNESEHAFLIAQERKRVTGLQN
jgi:hypothetical protein